MIKKHRALILYPEIPHTYWSFKFAVKLEGKSSAFPPLGALTIAAMFPKDDWEIRLIDQNVTPLKDKDIINADFIFISAMTVQEESVVEDIKRAKQFGKTTILGGPFVSTHMESTLLADHRLEGEAEGIIHELLQDLINGTAKEHYKAAERPKLDNVPLPALELINLNDYSAMLVQFSRGCPFTCEFCDITKIYGRNPRVKPNAGFLKELDQLYEAGWKGSVFIVDDNFIGNLPAIKKLIPEIIQWQEERRYPFLLLTEASVNLAYDEKLLQAMAKAGFQKVFLGIETPVEASLKETKKTQNLKSGLLESVQKIQKHGIEVMAGFIIGFDNDPEEIFDIQTQFIEDCAIPVAMVGLLTAIPGTDLYQRLEKEGRILEDSSGNNTDGVLNFVPKMDKEKLVTGYRNLMNKIYEPAEFYKRATRFLERTKEIPKLGYNHISWPNLRALFCSFFLQGILDRNRRHYWNFILNSYLNHKNRFSCAVTLAIQGGHFKKVNDVILNSLKIRVISHHRLEEIHLVLEGVLDRITAKRLRQRIHIAGKNSKKDLFINFEKISHFSPQALKVLFEKQIKSVQRYDIKLKLINLQESFKEILNDMDLKNRIEICDTIPVEIENMHLSTELWRGICLR